ncbi:hypothetical protein MLD38_004330 [Melastoma candidum]|uniref:Uncharacterized protein n=1 Tax=Melastoma candidum TaxID=119954 RepID=A0ACB9S7B0_9MYRT|nr:hypothetical protein MLD38_004330 [Melastoma candidum]
MGAEIQVKSNLLGHYSMRDLNDNSNLCSWPPYTGDTMLPNGHYCNGFLPRASAEVYPGYGKDMVKQTVLEHEAIFRKQVLELRRLYTKQKELMNEFKRKGIFKGRTPVETSLASSPLASQITHEDVAKWHRPGFPLGNSSYYRPFVSGTEVIQSPVNSARVDCTQAADVLGHNGFDIKSLEILESARPLKVPKKMIDLQLPADEYIDGDEQEVKGDRFPEVLTASPKSYARVRSVADLNKPLEVDEAGAYDPHGHGLARSSNLGSSSGISSFSSVINNDGRGWLSTLEAGDGKGKKSVTPDVWLQKSHFSKVATGQCQLGHSQERRDDGVEAAESESVMSPHLPFHYQFSSPYEAQKSQSKPVVSFEWQGSCSFNQKMPSRNGPSLETTSSSYVRVPHLGANQGASIEKRRFQSELPYQNGFYPGPSLSGPHGQLCFMAYDEKHLRLSSSAGTSTTRQVDLKSSALLNGPSSGSIVKDKKVEDHPNIPSWMRSETGFRNETAEIADFSSRELSLIQSSANYALNGFLTGTSSSNPWELSGQSHFYTSRADGQHYRNYEKHSLLSSSSGKCSAGQVDLNAAPLNGLTSALVINDKNEADHPKIPPRLKQETVSRNEPTVRAGSACNEARLIHSSSNHELIQKNEEERGSDRITKLSQCIASISCSSDTVPNRNDQVSEEAKPSSVASLVTDRGCVTTGHQIDLNSIFSEDESSAMPSVPSTTKRRIPEIDLEAPVVSDEFMCGPKIEEEIGGKSCIDEGVTYAAEAIVAMSLSTIQNGFSLDIITQLAGSMEDPLNWFADVATMCLNDTEMRSGTSLSKCRRSRLQDEESTSEEIDDFESMTLKLTETKSEDYLPKPFIPEIPHEDEPAANSVSNRPRRGQARRGRQRRDFQRDILPGLASLSRHEVTEDLQTFGGLMRATGHVWQSGLTRRNSRNGGGRGRRRTTITASIYAPRMLVQQPSTSEAVAVEDRSLTSWGKTTRRPRRQRCPAGNPPSLIPMMQS